MYQLRLSVFSIGRDMSRFGGLGDIVSSLAANDFNVFWLERNKIRLLTLKINHFHCQQTFFFQVNIH